MTRSRKRKLARIRAKWAGMPLASAMLAGGGFVVAAEPTETAGQLEEVVVTAQKRVEDVQKVPISLQVLSGETLQNLQVTGFDSFAKYIPSLSYRSWGPGQTAFFFRGISTTNGTTQLHAGYLPSTGMYVDDTPVTTIGGNLDIHIYDIARIEALAGPQGTLYGASSLSGTIRIITNKPDPSKFEAGYDLKADKWKSGDPGGGIEGFVNIPLSEHAAVRLVGYYDYSGGYLNNVHRQDTFQRYSPLGSPVPEYVNAPDGFPLYDPSTINNSNVVKNRWNTVETAGGRAALRVDLNDKWTITPAILGQYQKTEGDFAYDPHFGDLNVADYFHPFNKDGWYQAALTVEGKISNWDVLYSGGYFEREVHNLVDYSQYSVGYDAQAIGNSYAYTRFIQCPTFTGTCPGTGHLLDRPVQYTNNHDHYTKFSNEVRVTTPADYRLRAIFGAFYQKQTDEIRAEFNVPDLPVFYQVTGQKNVYYLSQMPRADRDKAVFTDLTFDVTEKLKLIGGIRFFWVDNTLNGFFGFNHNGYSSSAGEALCLKEGNPILTTPGNYNSGKLPCNNTDKRVTDSGETHRISLQYQFDPDVMMYGTYSTGFRPGGNNRLTTATPYKSDTLTNYEIGWKTTWAHKLRFNGAVFYEKWKDPQLSTQGQAGITSIINAGGAKSEGIEAELNWQATEHLNLSANGTVLFKDETTTIFCQPIKATGVVPPTCENTAATPNAVGSFPGTQMPGIPRNKANGIARYQFEMGSLNSFVQGAVVYQSGTTYSLENTRQYAGTTPAFGTFNLSAGFGRNSWSFEAYIDNVFDERGQLGKNSECNDSYANGTKGHYCLLNAHVYPTAPMSFGLKFGQRF